ncbi:MAG TPA: ubiquitin-like small modifier protein 1 [Rhodothermales bacterium]
MSETITTTVEIRIPTPLRAYTDGQAAVSVTGATVGEALRDLVERHPELRNQLFNDQGKLRSFVNVFRNDEDVRHLQREETPIRERDELSIIPSIAGGKS